MSLSRRAKRGISIFQKIQMTGKRAMYHLSQKRMIRFGEVAKADPLLVAAATEAMGILVKNGEEHNAKLSSVSDTEINTVAPNTEVGTIQSVPEEQEADQGC